MNKNLLPIISLLFKDIQMLLTDKHMLVSSAVSTPIILLLYVWNTVKSAEKTYVI